MHKSKAGHGEGAMVRVFIAINCCYFLVITYYCNLALYTSCHNYNSINNYYNIIV